jgi:hypothetical protein
VAAESGGRGGGGGEAGGGGGGDWESNGKGGGAGGTGGKIGRKLDADKLNMNGRAAIKPDPLLSNPIETFSG